MPLKKINFLANKEFSYDLLTPQMMASFISPEGMSEMACHKSQMALSSKYFNMKFGSFTAMSVKQISAHEEEKSKSINKQDERSIRLPANTPTGLSQGNKDLTMCEEQEVKSIGYLEADFEESRKQPNSFCCEVINQKTRKENKKLNDFDTISTEVPAYPFKEPLPYPLNTLAISQMNRKKVNWREVIKSNSVETQMHDILDRLFKIEQLQQETEENETRKVITRQVTHVKPRPMNSRQVTSVILKHTGCEKRRTQNCLKFMRENNCPNKKNVLPSTLCHFCYRSLLDCRGARWTYQHEPWNLFGQKSQYGYNYDQQSRLPVGKELTNKTLVTPIRPQSCNTHRQSITKPKDCRPKSSSV